MNTVGRTVRFSVAKALNFKMRENLQLHRVFQKCAIRVYVFLRTVVSFPIASTEYIRIGCKKDAKDANTKDAIRAQKTQRRRVSPALSIQNV